METEVTTKYFFSLRLLILIPVNLSKNYEKFIWYNHWFIISDQIKRKTLHSSSLESLVV